MEPDVPVELLLVPLGLAVPAALPVPVPEAELPEVDGPLPMPLLEDEPLERRSRSRSACEMVEVVSPDALPLAEPVPLAVLDELPLPPPAHAANAMAVAASMMLTENLLM